MSIDEFIDKLAKTAPGKRWRVLANGHIRCFGTVRCSDGEVIPMLQCPITSLRDRGAMSFRAVAMEIGLSATDMTSIMTAADHMPREGDRLWPLRKKLLMALGLNELEK